MRTICLALLTLILTGCAYTETTGFVDPEYKNGSYKISKVVLSIEGASLDETKKAEIKLSETLNSYNIDVIKFTDLAPPTRKYSKEKIAKLIAHSGADSTLTLYVTGRDRLEGYVPPVYHPGSTKSHINTFGNTSFVTTQTSPGFVTGGYSVSEPIMHTFASLIDNSNGNQVWIAEGKSFGEDYSSYLDLLISAGESAITDIVEKGLTPQVQE